MKSNNQFVFAPLLSGQVDARQCIVVRVSTPGSEDPPLHTLPVYVAADSLRKVGQLVVMEFGGNVFGSNRMHLSVVRPLRFTTTVDVFGEMFDMVGNAREPDALRRSAHIEMYNMTWEQRRGHGNLDQDHNGLLQPCKWSLPLVPIPVKQRAKAKASPGGSSGSAAGAAGSASTGTAASSAPAAPSRRGPYPKDANGYFDVNALLEDVLGGARSAGAAGSASGSGAASAAPTIDANGFIDPASTALDQHIDAMLSSDDVGFDIEQELEDLITAGETARQLEAEDKAMRAAMKQKAGNGERKINSLTK